MRDFMSMEVVRWNVICLLLTIAVTQGDLIFTSDKQYAQLHGTITLTCNTSESVSAVEFQRDENRLGICRKEVGCSTSNESKFSLKINLQPVGYDIYTLTINNFEVNDTGLYRCLTFDTFWQDSTIHITHAVDIKSVTLTPKTDLISVIENVPQIFRCVTSTCRPVATISWYLGSTQITSGNESNSLQDVTTSTLNYTFQKRHQDKRILCRGNGPSKPVCRFGGSALSSVVTLREDSEFRLNCTSDGNPLPSFSWIHPGGGQSTRLIISSIKRTHSGRYRIIAENRLIPLEQQSVYLRQDMHLTVDVQYPPDQPQCHLGETAISTNTVSAIREQIITISCLCDSNPPSIYWWSGYSFSKSGQDLRIFVQNATTINFTMENSMQFTIGNSTQGRRVSPFEVKVLFPPVVKPLTNVTVIEEGTVSVVCEITAGVPSKNDFQWERMSDSSKVSMEQTLIFANIDRKQTGYYKCTASNNMEPTGHDAVVGASSNTVYVDVQCKSNTEISLI
ncbi:MAM domain-containing glycosylphosphatidylinositol anchor protein 1-like [Mya arenaria]|uniref:MAM domain-containing glycosylphosphatidylinositol anchor protein 1-like n=1 Tax=Mya arenaria TaxID=6604 RepID=UPI0022DF4C23|nr:MAM domain-containing glycosylphosphatidylinositol anchor protein 1-like [Mya arenaria]